MFEDYGLVQMLQSQLMNLIGTAVVLFVLVLVGRLLINQIDVATGDDDPRPTLKKGLTWGAIGIFCIAATGFLMSAGSIAMKEIPRTGFNRGAVIEDGSNNN